MFYSAINCRKTDKRFHRISKNTRYIHSIYDLIKGFIIVIKAYMIYDQTLELNKLMYTNK